MHTLHSKSVVRLPQWTWKKTSKPWKKTSKTMKTVVGNGLCPKNFFTVDFNFNKLL